MRRGLPLFETLYLQGPNIRASNGALRSVQICRHHLALEISRSSLVPLRYDGVSWVDHIPQI